MSHTPTEFLRIANHTAEHFGFQTIDKLKKAPECRKCETLMPHTVNGTNKRIDNQNGLLSSGIATFCDANFHALEKPVLLYSIEQVPRTGEPAVTFHIFNVERSIAEAILIQATRALANELGYIDHTVRINSLGDPDSLTRYTREITNYLKKRMETMPAQARELMKEHPLLAMNYLIEQKDEMSLRSPNPLEYLSDQSRRHFREIVEFLDMSETPYEIDPKMTGHHECYSDAMFSIDFATQPDEESPISIQGGRFDEFVYRTTRTRTPAVGAVVTLKNTKAPTRSPRIKTASPSIYVVHLGFGPKIKSLVLIDSLRQAGISVMHDLANNSLSDQLRDAEEKGLDYAIIIGQKEYVEDTYIFRDLHARNQEFVDQGTLLKKLKRIATV